jgi:hypothetical protein
MPRSVKPEPDWINRKINMNTVNVQPTVEAIKKMAENLRDAAQQLDGIAESTQASGNFERVGDAANCVANLMPNLRLDLLIVRPLREFGAN